MYGDEEEKERKIKDCFTKMLDKTEGDLST